MPPPIVVAVTSDTHPNSTIGLCPPSIEKVEGGTHKASKAQRWQWRCWLKFWDEVESLKSELSADVYHINNGDIIDDPKHTTTEVVSQHKKTILNLALAVQEPALRVADVHFVTRGTEAHVGLGAYYEEMLAEDIGAEQDENDHYSAYWWLIEAAGVMIDCRHHPDTSGRLPHTMKAAAVRQSHIIATRYYRRGEKVPDLAFRSHIHYFSDSGLDTLPRTFFTPGWQLTPAFGHRLGGGIRPIGGVIIVCENGEYEVKKPKLYKPRRPRVWRPKRN